MQQLKDELERRFPGNTIGFQPFSEYGCLVTFNGAVMRARWDRRYIHDPTIVAHIVREIQTRLDSAGVAT